MAKHIQKVLAVGRMNGEVGLLENLFEELGDEPIDAVTLVGDLGAPWSKADTDERSSRRSATPTSRRSGSPRSSRPEGALRGPLVPPAPRLSRHV